MHFPNIQSKITIINHEYSVKTADCYKMRNISISFSIVHKTFTIT